MKAQSLILTSLLSLTLVACSNSWREGDTERSPEEVGSMLDEVQSAQDQSLVSSDVTTAFQYRDQAAAIYFAEAPGSLGPVGSLMSFVDFSFLGLPNLSTLQISQARVFLFDRSPDFGLVIGIDQGSGLKYYGFSGQGTFDGDFQAHLTGAAGEIVIESEDIDTDVLRDVVQMHVYWNNNYIGKFSTLVGYSQ